MRTRILCATLGIILILSGCATNPRSLDSTTRNRILSVVVSGRVNIVCGIWCAGEFGYNRALMKQYYMAGDWEDLAILVVHINFRSDLAYYYLGAAAEGMGAPNAAITYYEVARAITIHRTVGAACAGYSYTCDGIDLGNGLDQKLAMLLSAVAHGRVAPDDQHRPQTLPWQPSTSPSRSPPLTDDDIIGR